MQVEFYWLSFLTQFLIPAVILAAGGYLIYKKWYKTGVGVLVAALILGSFLNINANQASNNRHETTKKHFTRKAEELPPRVTAKKESLQETLAKDRAKNAESYKARLESNEETKTKEKESEKE